MLTFAPFLAPLDHVPLDRCPLPGIIAFRASVLPRTAPEPGYLEYELPVMLRDSERLAAVPGIRVEHVQHVGFRSFGLHFHSGASFGGRNNLPVSARPRRERLREATVLPRVLVTQTRGLIAEGQPFTAALREACIGRVRPKIMTAATAILGLLPLLVLDLHGTEIERPLAIVMIGGLVTSTVFTLLALPTFYQLVHNIGLRWRGRREVSP